MISITAADKSQKETIELVKGGRDREDLADSVGETANNPLNAISTDLLANDGAGEEAKVSVPTASELGTVVGSDQICERWAGLILSDKVS